MVTIFVGWLLLLTEKSLGYIWPKEHPDSSGWGWNPFLGHWVRPQCSSHHLVVLWLHWSSAYKNWFPLSILVQLAGIYLTFLMSWRVRSGSPEMPPCTTRTLELMRWPIGIHRKTSPKNSNMNWSVCVPPPYFDRTSLWCTKTGLFLLTSNIFPYKTFSLAFQLF